MNITPLKDRPELTALIAKAKVKYDAMTPLEKAQMHHDQRRSWVRGEMMLEHENMTIDEANALIDKVENTLGVFRP
jgi:hypothetical protein